MLDIMISSKKIFNIIFIITISVFFVAKSVLAQIAPGFEFENEIDARSENQDVNFVSGYNTTKFGIGILATNEHSANVNVNGIIESSKLCVYMHSGDNTLIPNTSGIANLTLDGIVGTQQGFLVTSTQDGSASTLTCHGDVTSLNIGGVVDAENNGKVTINIYGNIEGDNEGVDFNTKNLGIVDMLVTDVISGFNSIGINQDSVDNAKLTVWKLEKDPSGKYVKKLSSFDDKYVGGFLDKINYIIKFSDNVTLKKSNGQELNKSHGYLVAREREKIIIGTNQNGKYIVKAYNNGEAITDVDENENFYINVKRGGGVFLTVETDDISNKIPITNANVILNKNTFLYNGQIQKPSVKSVKVNNNTLVNGVDYKVSYLDGFSKNAGTYTVKIKGIRQYVGEKLISYKINKAENTLVIEGKNIKVKASNLSKKKLVREILKGIDINNYEGSLSFKKKKGSQKILINKTSGKITIKKGLKKGRYKVLLAVTASGNENYNKMTKEVTFIVVVK